MRCCLIAFWLLTGTAPTIAQPPAAADPDVPSKPFLAVDQGGHTGRVVDFAFAQDVQKLFTLSEDNTIQVWEAVTREHRKTLRLPWRRDEKGRLVGRVQAYSVLAVSPDGKTVAAMFSNEPTFAKVGNKRYNYEPFLVHLETGQIKRLPGFSKGEDLGSLTFSRDGDMLAARIWMMGGVGAREEQKRFSTRVSIWRGLLKAWHAESPALTVWKTWMMPQVDVFANGSSGLVHDLQFAPDGGKLAASVTIRQRGTPVGSILLWDLKGPQAQPQSISPGGAAVRLAWSPQAGRLAAEVVVRRSNPYGLAIDRDKDPAKIMVWTPEGLLLRSVKNAWPALAHPVFRGENEVRWVGVSSAGKPNWTVAALRFELQKNGLEEVGRFTLPRVNKWRISPDQQRLATWQGAAPNEIAILDLEPNAKLRPLYTIQATPRIAFSKKGHKFAWTGSDQAKLIGGIDLHTAEPLPLGALQAEDFNPPQENANLAKIQAVPRSSQGALIEMVTRGKVWLTVYAAGQDWVACTPEGYYAATPGGEKKVGWHVNNGPNHLASFYPLERFRKKLYRPDVIALLLEKGSVALALKVANALRGPEAKVEVDDLLPPRCSLELLEHDKGKVKVRIQAEARLKDQLILSLRLFLDGRPFVPGGNRGIKKVDTSETSKEFPDGTDKADLTWTFTLPGEKASGVYQLAVVARSRDASAPSNTVAVSFVNPAKLPALHVLTVGVNDYDDASLKLSFAAKDAQELAQAFQKHGKGELFTDVHTTTLLDKKANRQAVLDHIQQVRMQVKENDLFIVFFAGHGVKEKEQFYLFTVEAQTSALDQSTLSGKDLRQALGEFPCQVLLMLDACHAAGLGEKGKLCTQQLPAATDAVTRALTEDEVGVAVMCAAMGHEYALEKDGNGLFTRAVLDALRHAEGVPFNGSNHLLYTHHLQAFVFDQVSAQSGGRQHPFLNLPWVVPSFPVAKFAAK